MILGADEIVRILVGPTECAGVLDDGVSVLAVPDPQCAWNCVSESACHFAHCLNIIELLT